MLSRWTVALVLGLAGPSCGPRVDPGAVGPEPAAAAPRRAAARPASAGRAVVIGEMCPTSAGGRPGVQPWFVRQVGWVDEPDDAAAPVARGAARQFSVLGFQGQRAGLFSVIGLAEAPDGGAVAAGGFAGASPCALPGRIGADVEIDPGCVRRQDSCGVAIAEVVSGGQAPVGEDPEPLELRRGGACVAGEALVVDLDGDGRVERFAVASFLDEDGGPADELVALAEGGAGCTAQFSIGEVLPATHPRGFQGLDLIAVVDADGDGRHELILQLRYAGRRTVALYAAPESAARLELAGEAVARAR